MNECGRKSFAWIRNSTKPRKPISSCGARSKPSTTIPKPSNDSLGNDSAMANQARPSSASQLLHPPTPLLAPEKYTGGNRGNGGLLGGVIWAENCDLQLRRSD